MTERHTTRSGTLAIDNVTREPGEITVIITKNSEPKGQALIVPTDRLLAMIDATDPDAMRAYLRETVEPVTVTIADLAEADLADLVDRSVRGFDGPVNDPHLPAHIAAGIAEELLAGLRDQVPEADSPEDVDELPDVEQARAAGEQIGKIMSAFRAAYAEALQR